ncbi:MAG TPA: ATP-binding protein [Gemmatimonadaceae bacterium]|nr:ATP-binding protein [Gemmatimonadaceae bacterium]
MPSDVRCIDAVVDLVMRQCQALRYPPRACALNVRVALTEALSNAILRGNDENPEKRVCVRTEVTPERLVVEVVDEGAGFDICECLVDPTRPENIYREEGRGLFLMAALMDRVERYTDHGNVVRMTLRRHD